MNDAKKRILARRAQFVAAALAGLSVEACHKEEAAKPDASTYEPPPHPCLSPVTPPRDAETPIIDAGAGTGTGTDAGATKKANAPPRKASPGPCLLVALPDDPNDDG